MSVSTNAQTQEFDEVRDTPVSMPGDARRAQITALRLVLADHIALYLLYKKHHWTVQGPLFREIHLLLDDHADAVLEAVDPVAERIAMLGGVPIAAPSQIGEYTGVHEPPAGAIAPREMLEQLIAANEGVIGRIRTAIGVADDHGDPGTADLLTGAILRDREQKPGSCPPTCATACWPPDPTSRQPQLDP